VTKKLNLTIVKEIQRIFFTYFYLEISLRIQKNKKVKNPPPKIFEKFYQETKKKILLFKGKSTNPQIKRY